MSDCVVQSSDDELCHHDDSFDDDVNIVRHDDDTYCRNDVSCVRHDEPKSHCKPSFDLRKYSWH